jgi:hypothetical protein
MPRRCLSSAGSLGTLPPLPWFYSPLRLHAAPPASLRLSLRSAVPLASVRSRRWHGLPGSLGDPLVRLPCSKTPVGPPRLALRTTSSRGVAVSASRRSCLIPFFRRCSRCLAALRYCPSLSARQGPRTIQCIFVAQSHGLRTRCLRFAAFLSPRKLYGHARLASGCWPSFAGRDCSPAGSRHQVSVCSST